MHLHFERTGNTVRCDSSILSLTWMGRVPDESPSDGGILDEGWTLKRGQYYQEGWLASGNTRGIVGVTYTTSQTKNQPDTIPLRTNYNLRGHRAEITLVRWNEPYQKLASCDSTGIIFVWIKYEGRWSIELINDRNTQVTDFAWSHNGRMALICYQDGFVLVGSVAGQRYWSSMLNLDCTISCGLWTPDDQFVYFGTTDGQLIVMDIHGAMIAQVSIQQDIAITGMAWSCEKFKLEQSDDELLVSQQQSSEESTESLNKTKSSPEQRHRQEPHKQVPFVQQKPAVLAIAFKNGSVYVMKSYDEVYPVVIETEIKGLLLEWNQSGELLTVAGYTVDSKPGSYTNIIKFYTETGYLRYIVNIPNTQFAVSALSWGHTDKRLFVATGNTIHIGWVCRKVASLQLLSRLAVHKCLSEESQIGLLPLPRRLKSSVRSLFAHTIKCYLPDTQNIREFTSKPPPSGLRLHCTMMRHEELEITLATATNIGACYTLYLEYLGGLIPILKGKRNSKIRPEFIIFDPQCNGSTLNNCQPNGDLHSIKLQISSISNGHLLSGISDDSDSDIEDSCTASPRLHRRRRMRRRMLREQLFEHEQMKMLDDVAFYDSLPEQDKMVEVTSNIWGTKFKIHGVANFLPANLGSVMYKTSLLHLQPRQMTLMISELRDDLVGDAEPDPSFNPNSFSEDEDDPLSEDILDGDTNSCPERRNCVPIAPMTPNKRQISSGTAKHSNRRSSKQRSQVSVNNRFHHYLTLEERQNFLPPALDGPDDEYVNFFPAPEFLTSMSSHQSAISSAANSSSSSPSSSPKLPEQNVPLATRRSFVLNNKIDKDVHGKHTVSSVPNKDTPLKVKDLQKVDSVGVDCARATNGNRSCNISTNQSCDAMTKLDQEKVAGGAMSVRPKSTNKNFRSNSHKSAVSGRKLNKKAAESAALVSNYHWATKSSDLKYIDDDFADDRYGDGVRRAHLSSPGLFLHKYRSHSIGHLDNLDVSVATSFDGEFHRVNSLRETKKRLLLSHQRNLPTSSLPMLVKTGKSKSLDSGSLFVVDGGFHSKSPTKSPKTNHKARPLVLIDSRNKSDNPKTSWEECNGHWQRIVSNSSEDDTSSGSYPSNRTSPKFVHFEKFTPPTPQNQRAEKRTRSSDCRSKLKSQPSGVDAKSSQPKQSTNRKLCPDKNNSCVDSLASETAFTPSGGVKNEICNNVASSSPKPSRSLSPSCMRRALAGASSSILNSPLLGRRKKSVKTEISDDENVATSADDVLTRDFKDLGSLQKAQIKQKLRKGNKKVNGVECLNGGAINGSPTSSKRRQFTMHNKAPLWNESSQVYQLDFGGRVTQESAKNFQIEFKGQQVMQFGRIDGNAYTLDFQYPFTAIQAFAVALANVTQRLK